jgi:hypothetical protein
VLGIVIVQGNSIKFGVTSHRVRRMTSLMHVKMRRDTTHRGFYDVDVIAFIKFSVVFFFFFLGFAILKSTMEDCYGNDEAKSLLLRGTESS